MDYTTLSLDEVKAGLDAVSRDALATFGGLDARQVNWRPDPDRWSVAQCFDHLLKANRVMLQKAQEAADGARPRTVWQRLPVLPGFLGRMLVRSQAPGASRKFKASPAAQPAASDIAPDVIDRFIEQHRELVTWVHTLDERRAAATVMTSPFVGFMTYSLLDGCRLVLAHDRRHFEQARNVTLMPGFPGRGPIAEALT